MKKILEFFLCMLREDCIYSIKKFLTYLFSVVTVYLIIFTTKDYYYVLSFIAILLGIRALEKNKEAGLGMRYHKSTTSSKTTEEDSEPEKKVL